jgi:glycosyltransferase involved in cell wall biosynthesis
VALFSLEPLTISKPDKFYAGRKPTGFDLIDYLLAKKAFLAAVDDFRPDIISAHFIVSYGWLASYCHTCPVITTAWGSDLLILPQKSFIHKQRVIKALTHAALCTVDNENLSKAARQYIPEDKILKVIMGIEREVFDSLRRKNRGSSGPLRIIAPRGFQKVYDPETIVAAIEMLEGKLDFHIELLGNDPEADDIAKKIASMNLSDKITVLPLKPHDEYIDSLNNFDIYLSASLSDSTSVALLEAMAAGLFPVVSDIEGNREWIKNGVNGLLFNPGSPQSLAETITKTVGMRNRFESIAEVNREQVDSEAIWQDNMNRVKKAFAELIPNV